MTTLGDIIKWIRVNKGLTQEEFGAIIGVKKSAVQKYESGAIINMKYEVVRKLYIHFKMPPWPLYFPETVDLNELEETNPMYYIKLYSLNKEGRKRASMYIDDLSEIPKYQNDDHPYLNKKNRKKGKK